MCTNFNNKIGPCNYDQGGPLVIQENGRYALVGVVSRTNGCGNENYPSIYSRVTERKNWIQRSTNYSTQDSNCDLEPETTTAATSTLAAVNVTSENEVNDKDNASLIAGICSGVVVVIIIIAIGIFLYRRKIRDVEWRTRVEMANLERRVPGEHYEYNEEGVYYGDDKSTYYIDYVRTQSAESESSEEEVAGQDREYVVDSNGYVVPA